MRLLFHRVFLVALFMLFQLFLLGEMIWRFSRYFVFYYSISLLFSALVVLLILNNRDNPAYKIAWIIPIFLMPLFGVPIYLVFGNNGLPKREGRRLARMQEQTGKMVPENGAMELLAEESPRAAAIARYIARCAGCPPLCNTETAYLPQGEAFFEYVKEDLRAAERYIFLEFFLIREGEMWGEILQILTEKAASGLDVRVIYDDIGCMFTLPFRYHRKLQALGIRCAVFHPFRPVLSSRFNNRDHRKILVVDGKVAFTGGINLADEYINAYPKHGHWKDSAIRLCGEGAWAMTAMFLGMWGYLTGEQSIPDGYRSEAAEHCRDSLGFVQPYSDSPLDREQVGEGVYMHLISRAERYIYITTPYLIVSDGMMSALCTAAKSGVDVRVITPHIGDKWYVHAVTRHSYQQLIESGVRVFEYTPGFIHAKSFVMDDHFGVVGTVNMDYRSLYLHFECGVWLYGADAVTQIREDFLATQRLSGEITLEQSRSVSLLHKMGRVVLSVFSPLM